MECKQLKDKELISIDDIYATTLKIRCCDCGLVHDILFFKNGENITDMQVIRDNAQTIKERGYKYYSQEFNKSCFPTAVLNAGIFLQKHLDKNKIIKAANCEHGGCIDESEVIKKSKLPLFMTSEIDLIYKNGGIITIHHPIFNLHSCFVEPTITESIKIVNSWLGSNEIIINKKELKRFLPKHKINQRMYYIQCGGEKLLKR